MAFIQLIASGKDDFMSTDYLCIFVFIVVCDFKKSFIILDHKLGQNYNSIEAGLVVCNIMPESMTQNVEVFEALVASFMPCSSILFLKHS